jgi:molybdenum cofactor guanylyltransferase
VNAYVLVGGHSRRMGASKSALFLDRVVTAARPVFDSVIAVQRAGGEAMPIPTVFEEPHEGDGVIFGVACALQHAQSRAFILAVDYPSITSELLRFLRDDGRVPIWDGLPQPLCAVWDVTSLSSIRQQIADGRYDLRSIIERDMIGEAALRARFGGEPLRNVNTAAEWKAAQETHG